MPYLRTIIHDGHPTLRKVAKPVDPKEISDPLFQQLLDDMFETMYHAPGIGLAAPQINISKRIFVVDLQDEKDEFGPFVMINPKFTVTEGEMSSIEGCLSVPGMIGDIARYEKVVCSGLDRYGKRYELTGEGNLFARCLQHEMDHLNGVLYIDTAKNIRPAETEEEHEALAQTEAEAEGVARVNAAAEPVEAGAPESEASLSA